MFDVLKSLKLSLGELRRLLHGTSTTGAKIRRQYSKCIGEAVQLVGSVCFMRPLFQNRLSELYMREQFNAMTIKRKKSRISCLSSLYSVNLTHCMHEACFDHKWAMGKRIRSQLCFILLCIVLDIKYQILDIILDRY